MDFFRMLAWSLKLDYEFLFVVPGLSFCAKLRFISLKYLLFLRDRISRRAVRSATVFGRRYRYNDRFGIGSLQRVYCAGWRLKELLPPQPVVVDVGANLGQFNFFCRHYLGSKRVVSIEPIPECHALLVENAGTPADCLSAVVAAEEREVRFHVASDSQLSSLVTDGAVTYGGSMLMKTQRLDSLLETADIGKVDLLKIDTEGSEMDVLLSGERTLEKSAAVLVEMSIFRENTGNLFAVGSFLESRGFRLRHLVFGSSESPTDADGVFVRS